MNQYNQVLSEARPNDKKSLSFVGIFADTLLMASTNEARTHSRRGADVCATSLLLSLSANWRTGEIAEAKHQRVRDCLGMGAWRWRRTLDSASGARLLRDRRVVDLEFFTHRQGRSEPRFVCVDRGRLFDLIKEHQISPRGVVVYVNLAILHWAKRCPTTLTGIAKELHMAHRNIKAALDELVGIGLCRYGFRRGANGDLWIDDETILADVNTYTPTVQGENVARETAQELWGLLGLQDPPPVLTTKVKKLLGVGLAPSEIIDRTVAMGTLANALNPIAVVSTRLKVIAREERLTKERNSSRRERQVKRTSGTPSDEGGDSELIQEYERICSELGQSRSREVVTALKAECRRKHVPFPPPAPILVVRWAREQQRLRPNLELGEALSQALTSGDFRYEVMPSD